MISLGWRTHSLFLCRAITTHRRFLDQLSGLNHIHHILKCRFIRFMQSLSNSNNNKLVHLYNIYHKNKQSPSGFNIARIACEYNVKSCDIQQCNMLTQMNQIYVEKSKDLGNDQWKINFKNELIDVVHQTSESGLSPKEAKDILWFLQMIDLFNRNLLYFCICILF